MRIIERLLLVAVVGAFLLPIDATAQTFPDKPVRVIMPFPAGTGPDVVMRVVGEKLTRIWGQPVIIENRPGGNAFIAMTAVKKAPADGYTLVQVDNAVLTLLPHLFPKTLPFDPTKDFEPVAPMFRGYMFMAVPADTKFKNVADLVADAKARKGDFTYGSSGVGSPMHVVAAQFEQATGAKMTHVPYKETPQVIADISRQDLGMAFTSGATGGPMYRDKKIKFLAVAASKRHPAFPEVPTIAEAGGPADFDQRTWVALFAPRGIPKAVMDKLNADISRVLMEPDVRERLVTMGFEVWTGPPSELGGQQQADYKKYGDLNKDLKLSLE